MSRWVSARNASMVDVDQVRLCTMCALEFAAGTVRLTDSSSDIFWNGFTYLGVGGYGSISVIEENVDGIARGLQATLFGPEPALAPALQDVFQDRKATFYLALFDEHYMLVDVPEVIWSGRMDTMQIKLAGNESSLILNCEYRLRREPLVCRYTQADQQQRYPTDTFFALINLISGYRAKWGLADTSYANTTNNPGRGPRGRTYQP